MDSKEIQKTVAYAFGFSSLGGAVWFRRFVKWGPHSDGQKYYYSETLGL